MNRVSTRIEPLIWYWYSTNLHPIKTPIHRSLKLKKKNFFSLLPHTQKQIIFER